MNVANRSPEAYLQELCASILKADTCFENFKAHVSNREIGNDANAEYFIDSFCDDFNHSLEYILNTLGVISDNCYVQYEYDAVERKVLNLQLVKQELDIRKELYISRIKNATTFVPREALRSWITAFDEVLADAEEVRESYDRIKFRKKKG